MKDFSALQKFASTFESECFSALKKIAFVRHLPNGKWRVVSRKGKNLGTYDTEEEAKKRLGQVEFFKHQGADDQLANDEKEIDLTDVDELAYSAVVRKLREKAKEEDVQKFLVLFKKEFDKAYKLGDKRPEKTALTKSLLKLNKLISLKLPKKLVKMAGTGNAELVGKYLSDIIKFTMHRISPESRSKSIHNLKQKILNLNEKDIAGKNMPASSSIGSAITFVKHILFNHDAAYVRAVLNSIGAHLERTDENSADIVSNVREYKSDNRSSFLDEAHQGSFAPYTSITRQWPYDPVYNELQDQSPTRENLKDDPILPHSKERKEQAPMVGQYNNAAGINGAGPTFPTGGFISD